MFIDKELQEAQGRRLTPIVVTHHAPSPRYVRPWYEGDMLKAAFACGIDRQIGHHQAPLWVHRRMHDTVDDMLGETRMIGNPESYPGWEGRNFNPELVIEI